MTAFIADVDVSDDVENFNKVFVFLNRILINRQAEIEALKLAILTGENLMLEGPHGTAKSLLALEFFSRFEGDNEAIVFEKQLMKGTQPDELFGPMKAAKYREEAIWEHNTKGMLPEAHFAFIDEVYRGSDMLLPSVLSILNEKTFMNGLKKMRCPLISAIGTSNFTTDNPELDAFHDRWLLKVKVKPLESPSLRIKMLKSYMSRTPEVGPKLSIRMIKRIQDAIKFVKISEDSFDLYEEIVSAYKKKAASTYISDRRLCRALNIAKVATLLKKPSSREIEPQELFDTVSGIVTMGEEEHPGWFIEACENSTRAYEASIKETEDIRIIDKLVEKFEEDFRSKMSKQDAKDLLLDVKRAYTGIQKLTPDKRPKRPSNLEKLNDAANSMQKMIVDLNDLVNKQ